jgi:DNA-binding GntR family transcriptional regulator
MVEGTSSQEKDTEADHLRAVLEHSGLRYATLGDSVLNILRQAILTGVFAPGERLRQDALAEALGVSRMPVRSALLQLDTEGLVSFHPHRGAMVRTLKPDQVREIYELREVLETHALRRTVQVMSADRYQHLEELADALDAETDGDRFLELRLAFYRELYEGERYPLTVALLERLREDVGRYWARLRVTSSGERTHRGLLRFIQEGDVEGAVEWLRDHLRHVRDELLTLIDADVGGEEVS